MYNVRPIPKPAAKKHQPQRFLLLCVVILVLAVLYVVYALVRPVEAAKTTELPPVISGEVAVSIPWPASGQAAYGTHGYGLLSSHLDVVPKPTASIAKVITAMAILEKKPLKIGEAGPSITFNAQDVALYNSYVARDGSVVPVYSGQTVSEYQALQAIMLPSANNISDSAAIWAFGSLEAYRSYASAMVRRLGMTKTVIGPDASGFSPLTVSTASDLVRLGDAALDNPVLSEIFGQSQAVFPDYGTITNVNSLLGSNGIRGIKTGNTDEAGGCFLGAADVTVGGKKITVITAIMGSSSRQQALRDTMPLVQASVSLFQNVHVVKAGQVVGRVTTDWGTTADITADSAIDVVAWNGAALSPNMRIKAINYPVTSGSEAGTLSLSYGGQTYSTTLHTAAALSEPSLAWRLQHPF